jgi:hypothetical protein
LPGAMRGTQEDAKTSEGSIGQADR